jgi:aminoglycoside phosphotransferase (APT) family kinase protein
MKMTETAPDADEEATRLAAWVERTVGGRVTRIERAPRWRPAWNLDLQLGDRVLQLHARGEREARIAMPLRIADEVATHHLLEAHALPVPHAYGLCDDPYALVMDRLTGNVDLALAADDDERQRLNEEYLELLARIYAIPIEAAVAAGFERPADSAATGLSFLRKMQALYDAGMKGQPADPIEVFLRRWLRDHVPQDRLGFARFIPYDSFQFMFEHGRITGLLDFENAHIGDPLMDLAALRIRDTIKNLGDLAETAARYESVTGVRVDHDVVDYHTVLYNFLSVVSTGPPLADPLPGTDWISYLAWYVNSARWCFETIAEMRGYALASVSIPDPAPTRRAPAYRYLASGLKAIRARDTQEDYVRVSLGRLASYLKRVDEVGAAFAAADLEDLRRVLGHRPEPAEADAELVEFILNAGPEHEEVLVRLLDARAQRLHFSMASPQSLMLRHPRLRSLRPGARTQRAASESWPTGAIPGTR